EADLMNNDIIALLYNALNLKFDRMQPEGYGRFQLHAEGNRLQIPSFVYSNRGVEVRGAGSIRDLSRGADSPIEGYAIGTTRPLKELELPGMKQLDKLMRSLQTGSSSVRIAGTLGEPAPRLIPLPEIHSALRRLLWGQLRQEGIAPEP
ncbi:MAG: hypothetical protein JW810_11865, partial [Sedimentisphaerales bacterium]|nr:hypothetical protein [Sedimentisphaerales bacterium]